MKNKILEDLFSFLVFFCYACFVAGSVLLGILLLPLLFIFLLGLAVKELIFWQRHQPVKQKTVLAAPKKRLAVVRSFVWKRTERRAA